MRKLVNRFLSPGPYTLERHPETRSRSARRTAAVSCALFLVTAVLPVKARAASGESDWILYGNPEFLSIYAHTGKGNFRGTNITGPRLANPSQLIDLGTAIEDPNRSREDITAFLVGGTFGALTPALDMPSRPRLFVDINVALPATTEVQLARTGDPGPLAFPDGGGTSGVQIGERALIGRGNSISAQHQGPQVHAGLGVSFEVPLDDVQLVRFKPAAVYSRTIIDVAAITVRGVRLNTDAGQNQSLEDDFREIRLTDSRREVYHAAGPSLEVEYVPGIEWGPFSLSVYARGHASYILTSPVTRMQQCNVEGGQPEECALWKYTQDRWAYRASLGFHINWTPRPLW